MRLCAFAMAATLAYVLFWVGKPAELVELALFVWPLAPYALIAAIVGLEALTRPCRVQLTTDSEYVKKGMTEWIDGWVKRGWKNAQKKPVANRDLWEKLLELTKQHQVEWHWVRGHDGHEENERCDALARAAIESSRS